MQRRLLQKSFPRGTARSAAPASGASAAEEDAKQQKIQDDAGIKYVDLGPAFAQKAEDLYWEVLAKGDPEFVRKVRPLLSGK